MSTSRTLVVIGNGMVGHYWLKQWVNQPGRSHDRIVTFCEEAQPAYDRVHLSSYFSGTTAAELSLVEDGFFEQHGITLHLNDSVIRIDRARRQVHSARGVVVDYDIIIMATGSYPFVPPVPGHDRPQCLVYRTLDDLEAIKAAAAQSRVGTVIGGGLLGLEAAKALLDLGLQTHVVEFAPRLMAVQLDEQGGALLKHKIEALGVSVHLNKNTTVIEDGQQHRHCLRFADGESLETDLLLFSAGIRPRDALARDCDLALGPRGGIVINNHCQTSDPAIYAIGECALWNGQIFGLVAPGYAMARTVVAHLTAADQPFTGADMTTRLKLLGVEVASIGDAHAKTPGALVYSYQAGGTGVYKRLVVSADQQRLLGAVLVGDADDFSRLMPYYQNGLPLPSQPDSLILPQLADSPSGGGVDKLPDDSVICSCYAVNKATVCQAIAGGCQTVSALKASTQAATGCGGCSALLKSVLDSTLKKAGVAVNNHLCEHFAFSRQALFHVVQIEAITTFDALLARYGQGMGCEICKPAVASILASCWNDYVLQASHTSLQDSNDRFLANIQKDGSYSVVPRIPGGEITADGLIVIGQIAKDFGLYCKITGGQRIDLFGARLEQLPPIWEALIAAGFESGHAYGKALRTVKSCVGDTWCRYGVADSLGTAIMLENRYKGLRAPHKLKFGVSGCTRECAEAQGKDVGVIATESGWNLYVAGNGGMKPRHAQLLASGLDDAGLIRLIDRYLMFYIQTADRLQRTAVWMDALDGGLEYLKAVIVDDSLGIAATLEQQMQAVIDRYQCEWKTTLQSDAHRKLFQPFVNSNQADEHIVFVPERGQIRPIRDHERQTVEEAV